MVTPTQPISVQHFDALYSLNGLKLCKVAGALKHREIVG